MKACCSSAVHRFGDLVCSAYAAFKINECELPIFFLDERLHLKLRIFHI